MRITPTPQQIAAGFASVASSPVFSESAGLVAAGGQPVEMLRAMSLRPELLQGFAALSAAIYPGGIVEREAKELIILEASRTNRCQFCSESHESIARALGMAPRPMALLDDLAALPERHRLAVEYTRAAQRDSNAVPEELFDRLRRAFSEPEIVELTAMIGLISMLNLFNNCLHVRYHGEYEE
jgi:AhpD family alkylhydroperoxidase